ncbi:MAG: hypothetical protein P9X24_00605 [Candidatus Hatepunaea meridiana]|nr:hypothetical protein [Candidatus Hatepunaea meridiana]
MKYRMILFLVTLFLVSTSGAEDTLTMGLYDEVSVGSLTYKVYGCEFVTSLVVDRGIIVENVFPEGVFLVVYHAIHNSKDKALVTTGWTWHVVDSQGREYECSDEAANILEKRYIERVNAYNESLDNLHRLGVTDADILKSTGGRPFRADPKYPAWSDCSPADKPTQFMKSLHPSWPTFASANEWTRCVVVYDVPTKSDSYMWRLGFTDSIVVRNKLTNLWWEDMDVPDVRLTPAD